MSATTASDYHLGGVQIEEALQRPTGVEGEPRKRNHAANCAIRRVGCGRCPRKIRIQLTISLDHSRQGEVGGVLIRAATRMALRLEFDRQATRVSVSANNSIVQTKPETHNAIVHELNKLGDVARGDK